MQVGVLGLGLLLSAVIGLEREVRQKSAGLRMHSLVGVGAALFMLVSRGWQAPRHRQRRDGPGRPASPAAGWGSKARWDPAAGCQPAHGRRHWVDVIVMEPGAPGGTPLAMRVRRLWPDRNPLRRASDRAEFAVAIMLLVALLAGVPLTALERSGGRQPPGRGPDWHRPGGIR